MKCPKCGYTSFDYLEKCKKCGEILDDCRKALNLKMGGPTLFTGLKDENPVKAGDAETDKKKDIIDITSATTVSSFSEADFSPAVAVPLPPSGGERSENSSSGLETLGTMNTLQPRQENKGISETLPKIEPGSTSAKEVDDGLELTPSFSDESNKDEVPSAEKENKEDEFLLIADEEKPATGGQSGNDIPFDFSASDLENDINLSAPADNPDKELVELELDMEDEESLDQILADLGKED